MYRSEIDFHEPTQMFLGYDRVDEGVTEGTLRISHCSEESKFYKGKVVPLGFLAIVLANVRHCLWCCSSSPSSCELHAGAIFYPILYIAIVLLERGFSFVLDKRWELSCVSLFLCHYKIMPSAAVMHSVCCFAALGYKERPMFWEGGFGGQGTVTGHTQVTFQPLVRLSLTCLHVPTGETTTKPIIHALSLNV